MTVEERDCDRERMAARAQSRQHQRAERLRKHRLEVEERYQRACGQDPGNERYAERSSD